MNQRVAQVDALRGLALMGILFVNSLNMAYGRQTVHLGHFFNGQGMGEQAAMFIVAAFFEGKFYPIFAFLFGASFTFQANSMRRQDIGLGEAHSRMTRRMVWLLVAGALHGVLLFFGDILFTYALAGLLLRDMLAKGLDDHVRALKRAALYIGILVLVLAILSWFGTDSKQLQRDYQESVEAFRLVAQGSWLDVLVARVKGFGVNQVGALFGLPLIYGLFILGRLAVRHGSLTDPERHHMQWRKILVVGLGLGLPLNLLTATAALDAALHPFQPGALRFVAQLLGVLAGVLLAAAYVAAFMLYCRKPPKWMQAMGRMALSNYLAQSVIGMLVLQSPFLAIGPGLGRPALLVYCLLVIALQCWWSQAWLARHAHGPIEALWRKYTHGGGT